jgi:hypothetical protein
MCREGQPMIYIYAWKSNYGAGKMNVELDIAGIYYFIWSLVILVMLSAIGELMDRMTKRMDGVLDGLRASQRGQAWTVGPT